MYNEIRELRDRLEQMGWRVTEFEKGLRGLVPTDRMIDVLDDIYYDANQIEQTVNDMESKLRRR